MDESTSKKFGQWGLMALTAYAGIIVLMTARGATQASVTAATTAMPPFTLGPSLPSGIDLPVVSRASVGHDGVDHSSTLNGPLVAQWLKPINVGVVGGGVAEAAVDGSGVYVGSDSGWLHALSADGGARWTYFDINASGGLPGAPALDNKTVYIGTSAGNLIALDKKTGRPTWMHRFAGSISGAPLVFDESVYAMVSTNNSTSYLIRIKRTDGTVEWQSEVINAGSNSGPAIDRVSGLIFVGATDRRVHAFSLKSGRSVWDRELDAEVDATPAVISGTVFVASNGEFTYAIKAQTGQVLWKALVMGGSKAAMTWEPANNVVVIGTNRGLLYAFDRHSGKTRWIDKTGSIFTGMGGAAAVSRTKKDQSSRLLWVTCADQTFCALDPKTGKITEQIKTAGPIASSPAIYDDSLYIVESTGALRKYSSRR